MTLEEAMNQYEDMPVNGSPAHRRIKTTKSRHGKDFYIKSGKKGGSTPTTKLKGFAYLQKHDPDEYRLMLKKAHKKRWKK